MKPLLFALLLGLGLFLPSVPAEAIPSFSARYQVPCSTCHTVPPRLNKFGLAFQANMFNWPIGDKPTVTKGLSGIPVSLMGTLAVGNVEGMGKFRLRTLEAYASDGFSLGGDRRGGYFIDIQGSSEQGGNIGDLEDAYVGIPIEGRHGELMLVAGQSTPLLYQDDYVNYITETAPYPLAVATGAFSLETPAPIVRLDYFARRGEDSANGNYLSLAVPFTGALALNKTATPGNADGLFAHAFHREGYATVGVVGYRNGSSNLEGLLGTYAIGEQLFFTLSGTEGNDPGTGHTRQASLKGEYDFLQCLSVSGTWEAGSFGQAYPVAALSYYPLNQHLFRITAETIQQPGQRSSLVAAKVQF